MACKIRPIFVSLAVLALPCLALEPLDPERGDAMEAAIRKDDAEGLKKLLLPRDCEENASFVTAEAKKGGYQFPLQNLITDASSRKDKSCYHALLEYGVEIQPNHLERADLNEIKSRYPDFANTLGRKGMKHAATVGNTELLQNLLKLGVPAQPSDLDTAVTNNNPGAVRVLIAAKMPKDTKGATWDKGLTMTEIARKRMFFDVLAALGEEAKYAAELKPFREGRPGPSAHRFVGEWSFINPKNGENTRLILAADGSGLYGWFDLVAGSPVLWKLVEQDGKAEVLVEPVPAYAETPKDAEKVLHFPVKGNILGSAWRGVEDGRKARMSSDHRDAFTAPAANKPYAGPAGEWGAQADIEKLPAEEREQAREFLKTWKLTIAKDGTAKMSGPQTLDFKVQIDEATHTLTLLGDGRPPRSLSASEDWNTLSMAIPGETMALKFVRVAK